MSILVSNNRQMVTPDFWKCSICYEVMDKNAAISKRCLHVFHKSCVEQWITNSRENCPTCRHPMQVSDLTNNPEFSEQCRIWRQDPTSYKNPELDQIRPKSLAGRKWEITDIKHEEITIEQLIGAIREIREEIREERRVLKDEIKSLKERVRALEEENRSYRKQMRAERVTRKPQAAPNTSMDFFDIAARVAVLFLIYRCVLKPIFGNTNQTKLTAQ